MRLLAPLACCLMLAVAAPVHAEPVTFGIAAPEAKQVFLAGEMTDWDAGKVAMQRDEQGTWHTALDLAPGQWLYKFVVDGQWVQDPATEDHDADGQGGQHSFVFVGDGAWTVAPGTPRGEVQVRQVASRELGESMTVNVYLPPGFRRGRPLPVLWLLHGSGMDADQWFRTGHVERYMDHLIASGAIRPFVIVMPSGHRGSDSYDGASERFIATELPLWLASTYDLHPTRARTAVAGMSLGGYGTVALAVRHPQQYGFGVALAGWYPPELLKEVGQAKRMPQKLVLRCGTRDDLLSGNHDLVAVLKKRHAAFDYAEEPGAHTFHFWSVHTALMLTAVDGYFRGGRR
ncbi:MAG TPA: alpha/beta hydrolase-fold protein [Burkholderiaceae bacterium]